MGDKSPESVDVTFAVSGLNTPLHVMSARGQEGLSQLYTFEVDLASKAADIALGKVVGQPARLTLEASGGTRYVHGLVSEFQQLETHGGGLTAYRATLVPAAWRLNQNATCRVFQKQDVRKIVTGILDRAKIEHRFRSRGNRTLAQRDYCVQYRESDWAFISRLLEEEGFFYFFEHGAEGHKLHIGDSPDFFPAMAGTHKIPLHAPDAMVPGEEQLTAFSFRERLGPDTATLTDFNFERPAVSMAARSMAGQAGAVERFDYPGGYFDEDEGKRLAGVRLEELQSAAKLGEAWSNCPRMAPGYKFQLEGHPSEAYNRKEYVASQVLHGVEKAAGALEGAALDPACSYTNSLRCLPAGAAYRPPRITPRPFIRGVQTAFVVGPKDEEVYTDKHGRVKVQFHWDREGKRDANSSCWVRVSQLWAGQGWGAIWIPRVGQEVIVDFLEGDPDRPIITGRVYNALSPPPYDLPAAKTRSAIKSASTPGGKGSNEIRFEDRKGAEELYTHAQRDRTEVVERNMSTSVGGGQTLTVGGDRVHSVTGKEDVSVKKDRSVTVKGGEEISVEKDRATTVTGKDDLTVLEDLTVTVSGDDTLKVKGTLSETASQGKKTTAKSVTITVVDSVKIQCGGTSFTLSSSGIDLD